MDNIFNELFEKGYSADDIIAEMRKLETLKKDAEIRAKKKKELADARSTAVKGLANYLKTLLPEEDFDTIESDLNKDFEQMEEAMEKINAATEKISKAFAETKKCDEKPQKSSFVKRPQSDDEKIKSWLKSLPFDF